MPDHHSLELHLTPELVAIFFPLFQEGAEVEVEVGSTIRKMLAEQFGISADYQTSRITTIFLNHKAVDDAVTALVEDGATLALSGAMPGLVGATMRSGGHLSTLRDGITYRNPDKVPEAKRGRIRLKLFNLLLKELAPRILLRGILLEAERFQQLLSDQPESFRPRGVWLDGHQLPTEQLRADAATVAVGSLLELKVRLGDH